MTEKGKEDFIAIKLEVTKDMRERIQKIEPSKLAVLSDSTQYVRDILSDIMIDSHTPNSCNKE